MKRVSNEELRKLKGVASYQLGRTAGDVLFNRLVMVVHSRKTGRMKLLYRQGRLLATLRPSDGLIALSTYGAELLLRRGGFRNIVTIDTDVAEYVRQGRNVFARHVKHAGPAIRPEDEVVVVDQNRRLVAVGRAALSAEEMVQFKRGVAVKVRRGASENTSDSGAGKEGLATK